LFPTVHYLYAITVLTLLVRHCSTNMFRAMNDNSIWKLEGAQRAKWLMHCGRDTHCWRLDWVRPHSFEWAEWCIVCRDMYLTRVWKVDSISVWTRYCWECHFIGFLKIQSGSRSKWGFRRNVQKCNSYITQNGFTTARRAVMTSWRPSASTQSIYRPSAHRQTHKSENSTASFTPFTWWI